ncbi:alpha/beta hydrolase [Nonomuraea sp. NPDC049684]|uniref:alpha/beta hydrolase n=1 Tax=unclassified Nonomuraea TaxID=2593643 RepID=UPI0037B6DE1A
MRKIVGWMALLTMGLTGCGGTVGAGTTAVRTTAAESPAQSATTSAPASAPPTGPNVSGCFTEQDGKIFTHVRGLPGVITGDGPVGVVISYERRGTVCSWRPLSDRLVAAGYRVLLYARDAGLLPEDGAVAMGKRLAKEKGVERLFLVGGSIGATASVPAAERLGAGVAGVVALSGEIDKGDAAALTVPLLQIGSEHDSYGGAASMREAEAAATKAPDNQVLVIPGESLHASALLTGPHSAKVLDTIVAFMDRHKG